MGAGVVTCAEGAVPSLAPLRSPSVEDLGTPRKVIRDNAYFLG